MIPYINDKYYETLINLYNVIGESKRALEVGLGWGTSAQAYLNTFRKGKLDSIEQADYHGIFREITDMYKGRMRILVGKTPDIFGKIKLDEYDFIYIDAAHDYEHVMMDIIHTWKALKSGGVMAFDDYGIEGETEEGRQHGVKAAVDEFFYLEKPIFLERNIVAFRKE